MIDKFSKNQFFILLSFVLFSFIIFSPSYTNPNFFWDDERFIFLNPEIMQAPSWYSFWQIKSIFYKSWPIGYSFFWFLTQKLSIENLYFYKTLNILIHSFNGYLVLHIFRHFKFQHSYILALIFLIHPLHVEAVSWIFQILTILSFTFFLISFDFLLVYLKNDNKKYIIISFILFVFSLWTKSIAILCPFLFLLLFWNYRKNWRNYFLLIPFFAASFFIGYSNVNGTGKVTKNESVISSSVSNIISSAQNSIKSPALNSMSELKSDSSKMLHDFIYGKYPNKTYKFEPLKVFKQAMWHYPFKILLPLDLHFIYKEIEYNVILIIASFFILIILPILLWIRLKNRSYLILSGLTIVFLVPYLGITNITFFYWSYVSDRYTYFFLLFLPFSLGFALEKTKSNKTQYVLSVYCLLLAISSINYSYKFNRPLELYREIVDYKSNPLIYSLLFEQYLQKLDLPRSKETLERGLKLFPDDPQLKEDTFRLEGLRRFYEQNSFNSNNK